MDKKQVIYTHEEDTQDSDNEVMGAITVVLKLDAGQQLWVCPVVRGTDIVWGRLNGMFSWFGAYLLKTVP